MHIPVNIVYNTKNYLLVNRLLRENNIEYCLFFGTLLGQVRENNILKHDDDIDFYVNSSDYQKVIDFVKKEGLVLNKRYTFENVFTQVIINHDDNGVKTKTYVDFYFYNTTELDEYLVDKWHFFGNNINKPENHMHVPKKLFYPLREVSFCGDTTFIPNESEEMVKFLYGPRFMEPLSKAKKEYRLAIVDNKPAFTYRKKQPIWDEIYNTKVIADENSSFAQFCLDKLVKNGNLLDIGCGNARDSAYFNKNGFSVCGIDGSTSVIYKNGKKYPSIKFIAMDIAEIDEHNETYDNIYTRFFLHSIPKELCSNLLKYCYSHLNEGGKMFIECRSINDPMYGVGEKGENEHEFINHHYRRFLVLEELVEELRQIGFTIESESEDKDLSIVECDNPALIRIIATRL